MKEEITLKLIIDIHGDPTLSKERLTKDIRGHSGIYLNGTEQYGYGIESVEIIQ